MNEKAMQCTASNPAEIQEILKDIRTEQVYRADKAKTVGVVHFELDIPDLDTQAEAETQMFVYSNGVGAMVYSGPFQSRFSVEIDERLLKSGPGDNLEFRLFRLKQNQICVHAQQVGNPYWQPGASVKVHFLRERYMDKQAGVPIGFEVDISKP